MPKAFGAAHEQDPPIPPTTASKAAHMLPQISLNFTLQPKSLISVSQEGKMLVLVHQSVEAFNGCGDGDAATFCSSLRAATASALTSSHGSTAPAASFRYTPSQSSVLTSSHSDAL